MSTTSKENEIPNWLTKEFIKIVLEEDLSESLTIDNIVVDRPVAKGDNYTCEILRAKVEYRTANDEPLKTSLIIKAPIVAGGVFQEFINQLGVTKKETRVYNEFIPKLDEILGEKNLLTPKLYHSNPEGVIILEDLKENEEYVMVDRQKQLDYDHCVVALKALAIFHAASVKLHEQEPEHIESIGKENFFTDSVKEMNIGVSKINFEMIAKESESIPELKKYTEKFLEYSESCWERLVKLMNPKNSSFNVLNHGDFWVNNMLFRYENDKPVGLKLLDFQISRYTNPGVDLVYFLHASVQEDLRAQRTDELLDVYLEELNHHLEKFGAKPRLTEHELKSMVKAAEFFSIFVSVSLLPVVIANPKECSLELQDIKVEDLQDLSNSPMKSFYRSKKYVNLLSQRMKEYERNGWF